MSEEFALEELVRDGWATDFEEVLCTACAQIMQQSRSQLLARATLTCDENWNFGQGGFLQLGANPMVTGELPEVPLPVYLELRT